MKFLVDAQPPRRLAALLQQFLANIEKIAEGFDAFDFIEINQRELIFHF